MNAPLIESLVALSIMFVAVELTRSWSGYQGMAIRYPWLIAFTFGLLHGLAFAGSLADIGLPPHNIAGALLLFNCGVEVGQILFIAAVLTTIAIFRSRWATAMSRVRWLVPYSGGALACFWTLERIAVLP